MSMYHSRLLHSDLQLKLHRNYVNKYTSSLALSGTRQKAIQV